MAPTYDPERMAERPPAPWVKAAGMAAAIGFGSYIALTSLVGILLGLQAGEGWLAILYGALGITMGVAGAASAFVKSPLRSGLLGWFLFGIATRAVVGADVFDLFIAVPIALALLAALLIDLSIRPSVTKTVWGLAGALLSAIAFLLLAIAAPNLPVICPSLPAEGQSSFLIEYPADNIFPFDGIATSYFERCAAQRS